MQVVKRSAIFFGLFLFVFSAYAKNDDVQGYVYLSKRTLSLSDLTCKDNNHSKGGLNGMSYGKICTAQITDAQKEKLLSFENAPTNLHLDENNTTSAGMNPVLGINDHSLSFSFYTDNQKDAELAVKIAAKQISKIIFYVQAVRFVQNPNSMDK